ncbi:MAG: hypothetical protein ISS34_02960 [Candidatus Omnitrophica bacterium]|nr:hypothetical protein [Candidatus Omnitrophota bacterium]
MILDLFVLAEEDGFLEPAIEAAEVDVEEHGDAADLAGAAEVEEVVLEELVAPHKTPRPCKTV